MIRCNNQQELGYTNYMAYYMELSMNGGILGPLTFEFGLDHDCLVARNNNWVAGISSNHDILLVARNG